jgi:hypothetical protein
MSRKGLKGSSTIGGNDVLTIDQLRHQDDWVLDTERYRCHVCTRNFTRFRRKHHCRKVRLVAAPACRGWKSYEGLPLCCVSLALSLSLSVVR